MTVAEFFRIAGVVAALALVGAAVSVPGEPAHAADRPSSSVAHDRQVEVQIERLKHTLAVTPAQLPQWNALAAAMKENARKILLSRADRAKIHPANVIDTLYAERRDTQARLERLERIIPVAEALYAVLSNSQKAKADLLFGALRRHHEVVLDTGD